MELWDRSSELRGVVEAFGSHCWRWGEELRDGRMGVVALDFEGSEGVFSGEEKRTVLVVRANCCSEWYRRIEDFLVLFCRGLWLREWLLLRLRGNSDGSCDLNDVGDCWEWS